MSCEVGWIGQRSWAYCSARHRLMRIYLQSRARKVLLLGASLLLATAYTGLAGARFVAAFLSQRGDLASLQRATHVDPQDAEYHYLLGRYFWLVLRDPDLAVPAFRAAVALNPYAAPYWFDLAAAYELMGYTQGETDALEHAIQADPTTPSIAWEAANFYIVQGNTHDALKEFRVVLANDPDLIIAALDKCWRIEPDVDALLRDVLPPMSTVNSSFLKFLLSKNEMVAASKVWAQMTRLNQPVEKSCVFDYIRSLILAGDVDKARLVWHQSATLSALTSYQPTPSNLVVNGDFGMDVLNGGFDWTYIPSTQVSLELDPTQFHDGTRSLLINFDARSIEDVGIRQLIPVQPNTRYEFSAYFRVEDLAGAGGPRFLFQDLYDGTTYFASEDLKDAAFWKQVDGFFVTGPKTKMLVLRVQRFPAGPIKGELWIDGIRLVQKAPEAKAPKDSSS